MTAHNNSSTLSRQILEQLVLETEIAKQFLQVLNDECAELMAFSSPEPLRDLAQKKWQIGQQLEAAYKVRMQLVQSGFPVADTPNSLSGIIDKLDPQQQGDLAKQWNNYNELVSQAKSLNESNAIMIHSYLKYNQDALDSLNRAAGVQHTYDGKGMRKPVSTGKPLASA